MLRRYFSVFALVVFAPAAASDNVALDIQIAERRVVGGELTRRVSEGDNVKIRWQADEKVELHLHGYEIAVQVPSAGVAHMAFTANVSGRFPISHHGFGEQAGADHGEEPLLYLEVYPE